VEENGFQSELGPNTVLETSPIVTKLIEEAGLTDKKTYADETSKNRYIVKNGKPTPLAMSPLAFIKSPLFSWKAKLRLMGDLFVPAWDNSYEENLSQFVTRRLGKEFLDYAINPFVAGVYAGEPNKLSVKHGFPKLYELEQKYGGVFKGQFKGARDRKRSGETSKQNARMFSFPEGLKMLPERIAKMLDDSIIKNTNVTEILKRGRDWNVFYKNLEGIQHKINTNAVLYAGRAFDLAQIKLGPQIPDEFKKLANIYHPPVTVISLGFKRSDVVDPLKGFGVLVPKVENFNILGILYSSTLFPNRAPEGHVLLTVFVGGSRQPEISKLEDDKLVKIVLDDVNTILGLKGEPTYKNISRWDKAIPQYQVGYGKYKKMISGLTKENSGLFFTGNFINGISVADTIVHATDTAESIHKFFTKETI
jgi:oxygen-dependent protoporphyrinogen oxidase